LDLGDNFTTAQLRALLSLSSHVFLLVLRRYPCFIYSADWESKQGSRGRSSKKRTRAEMASSLFGEERDGGINSPSLLRVHAAFGYLALYLALARCTPALFISYIFFFLANTFHTKIWRWAFQKRVCMFNIRSMI
jgi:hypothetical protein